MLGGAELKHNPIFERFVDKNAPDRELEGMIAYCLYKRAKREWATEHFQRAGHKPSEEELEAYIRTWTPSRIAGALKEAEAVINAFAGSVIESNESRIREDALRGTFWRSVGTSMFAALLYTLILIAVVVVAQVAGVDVVSIVSGLAGQVATPE
ncbi:hypothetical protein L0F51_01945 [Afifella sp. H1R]|uniref:hypothetical protein n=1 Tax=Afifella sp. H1R TaxID=2908841 RepID=UPI001F42C275|nr:hypothetical protein [Afifella sp. H1R]MCF1502528.1 hypothetical protein [Afifella sp. H1R]